MVRGFTFFESYYEAIAELEPEDQLAVYDAITRYSLYGFEPELSGVAKAIFAMAKPTIDRCQMRKEAGSHGGRKRAMNAGQNVVSASNASDDSASKVQASSKQTSSKTQASGKQTLSDRDRDRDREKGYIPPYNPPLTGGDAPVGASGEAPENGAKSTKTKAYATPEEMDGLIATLDPGVQEAVKDWAQYKAERGARERYTAQGFKALITTVRRKTEQYGADRVSDIIAESMGQNYQGIVWDRLNNKGRYLGGGRTNNSDEIDSVILSFGG